MAQKGFIPIVFILILVAIGTSSFFVAQTVTTQINKNKLSTVSPTAIIIPTFLPTVSPTPPLTPKATPTKTPAETKKPTITPTKTSTPTPTSTNSSTSITTNTSNLCGGYTLTGSTSSVEISVIPATGYLKDIPYAEIKSNGCKTFDGQSLDTLTNRGYNSGSNWGVTFGTVYPGTYTVRLTSISSDSKSVAVSAGTQAKVTINITGDTPVVAEKPICTTPSALPSASGSAPLTVNFYIGYIPNSTYTTSVNLRYIEWDINGDGTWDASTNYGNPYTYTYQTPGAYNIRARLTASNGDYSNPCQTTVTVN